MTNQELWPIGTRVEFNYDDLQASGKIIQDIGSMVVVLLDEGYGGWGLDSFAFPEYAGQGRQGWNVPYTFLKRIKTKSKLGNDLI